MTVNELNLKDFRNFSSERVTFDKGVNLIVGKNAQGKTNLIEAIYYLATGRSFRQAGDKDLISFSQDSATIRAGVKSGERDQTLEARLFRGKRREIYANGSKLKKVSELTGRLAAVQFGPDDLDIVKGGAATRRKLMDHCLSQLRPGYMAALAEFNRLYGNKTRILRDYHDKPSLLELLDDFNIRIAEQSARLMYYRTAFVSSLMRRAAEAHSNFSGCTETLSLRYKTVGGMDPTGKKTEQLLLDLLEHQRERYHAEIRSGMCLSGIQKDDIEILINGMQAQKYGSQGQMRTASVSIKLAERDIHFDDKGEYPILLLDDVLSELDEIRQNFILSTIAHGQVFITCCDEKAASSANAEKVLYVEEGKLKNKM